ncbi:2-oxoglutarate dehydrogenase complex dihydrolipoyllysine-residue succinyltransferase [Pelobacter seleniigenes]|uniref:2-oxoglutarate dehydrogenase complex dihydrolipoyllysine-residue succinyltransferase n=1 Tax=Pelobacter seleniigenes TaxID=407188 RepID=UPI0004A714A5|nr:2-oxoglutarate dehydrogenase complex dihydrolipoyllysine-residue succinyltransferase [Pelobacter seleniigenes]
MDIIVPQVGESIVEAEIGEWFKKNGEFVEKDDLLMELETEKVNVELNAEVSGKLTILVEAGETVEIGAVIGRIDESAAQPDSSDEAQPEPPANSAEQEKTPPPAAPAEEGKPEPTTAQATPMNPAVKKIAAERGIDLSQVKGSGRDGRILVDDLPEQSPKTEQVAPKPAEEKAPQQPAPAPAKAAADRIKRVPMSQLRKKVAEHLMKAKQETAMLTTFNEADMSRVIQLRKDYKEAFQKKYGCSLGFMSFFVKACAEALKEHPEVNASIDGNDIVYHNYYDIGIAVGSKRGLVVPVVRDTDSLDFHEIETIIRDFAERANSGKLTLDELQGGTFTITNGGVYGSVLSTPLLNPPQSAILGMHGIQDRPVVRDGEIVIRPIMNLALSYDHRIIDGQQAVTFLKQVKTYIDNPETLLLKV